MVGQVLPVLTCASNAEGASGLPFLTCSYLAKTVNNQTPLLSFEARSVALRGREGGATAELGDDLAGTLRAGGGDKAHVLAPAYSTKLHNTTSNQAGKFYEEYTPSLQASSPAPAVIAPMVSAPVQRSVERPRGDGLDTLIAFDTTQITSKTNRCQPKAGDPCHPLAAQAHPPVIAFSSKDYGGDAEYDLAPTLRAGNHNHSHANGGQPPAIAFDSRQDPVSSTEVFGALGSSSPQAQAVSYAIQAGAVRQNPNSGPDGVGVQLEHAYTLEARSEVQMVAAFSVAQNSNGFAWESDVHPTIQCKSQSATSNQFDGVRTGMAVRRLIPTECERLQGFPDGYTRIPVKKAKRRSLKYEYEVIDGQLWQMAADGPRYKALGNSMAVPNMRWLGRRIEAGIGRKQMHSLL